MTKLSKKESEQQAEIVKSKIAKFNESIEPFWNEIEKAVELYNETVEQAQEFRSDIANAIDEYIGDKSESWQEGDRGQAFEEWKGEWENELEPVAVEAPEEVQEPEMDHADFIRDLPDEPNS